MELNTIITKAKQIGITLTNAELGTEACNEWLHWSSMAIYEMDDGNLRKAKSYISKANQTAI